ncbi:GntR family transcriptional regulator [Anaerotalea alkaliphila]|uniref:GntR family transcriptional regulator n=1 Tax=Anaerotalea alkaliphila TaxID=2662126 RepID=A0A7X5HUC1_9FIRM|nr:GntR family transcriptional regulator [Anaerotalea alkaliphila]NDL66830.1 GntR family transcriptional regulator [Anaerotalea alkaliphila]
MKNLHPIKMLPAREQVASALRKAILSRELQEGEEITLESTAQQLGVSSTPVREAFQILARDGLIKLRPNKGAVVLGVNEKTIRDHYETRAILEREAVALVCRNGADISDIVHAYGQMVRSLEENDIEAYTHYNQMFHWAIWTAAGNDKIKALLAAIWNGLPLGRKSTEADYARISCDEHKSIVEAIRKRDAEKAKEHMNAHILRSMENILARFE